MTSKGDREFLEHAVKLGFAREESLQEIRSEQQAAEKFLGRPVPISHLLLQRGWITPDQAARIETIMRRRVLLCPHCWGRVNAFMLLAGQAYTCRSCKRRIFVPSDPAAELMAAEAQTTVLGEGSTTRVDGDAGGDGAAAGRGNARFALHRAAFAARGFELHGEVGAGGMGVVYEARQHPLGRRVAVKVLHADLGDDPDMVRRFFREARGVAAVRHPNVVPIHYAGTVGGAYFLVLEWVPGRNLRELSRSVGPMPFAQAARYAIAAGEGLAAVHEQGLVHRDVKPANLLVREDGAVYVTDFGLVRTVNQDGTPVLTKTGQILGTIQYMAPEQLRDSRRAAPASDQYALGATLYHLLCGRPPFDGEPWSVTALKLAAGEIPRLNGRALGLPPEVVAVVSRMMRREPEDRFASVGEAVEEVRTLQGRLEDGRQEDDAARRAEGDTQVPGRDAL